MCRNICTSFWGCLRCVTLCVTRFVCLGEAAVRGLIDYNWIFSGKLQNWQDTCAVDLWRRTKHNASLVSMSKKIAISLWRHSDVTLSPQNISPAVIPKLSIGHWDDINLFSTNSQFDLLLLPNQPVIIIFHRKFSKLCIPMQWKICQWLWPLISKISRVNPLIMVNMSAKFGEDEYNI